MTASIKSTYNEQGCVVVPGLILPQDFRVLEDACDRVISKTRTGLWPHRRTVGKQFPPFDNDNPDSWGVQHVMHPDLNEPAFARWYTSEGLRNVSKELLACEDDSQLQMGMSIPVDVRYYTGVPRVLTGTFLWMHKSCSISSSIPWNTILPSDGTATT
jgi:hypothetical protein